MLLQLAMVFLFFFKHKTAYEMRISDWSSDVCSSDLGVAHGQELVPRREPGIGGASTAVARRCRDGPDHARRALGQESDLCEQCGAGDPALGPGRTPRLLRRIEHQSDRKSTRLNSSH